MATTNSLDMAGGFNGHGPQNPPDHATSGPLSARTSSSGAVETAVVPNADITELIGELQSMLSEALERQQGNPQLPQLTPVGGTRWREVHSRLMSQAGAPPCPLERTSSQEVAELQEALQQSSSALRSSQQQLQLLSARVEDLQAQLEAECERMVASVQDELRAAHESRQEELRELQERLKSQHDEAGAAAEAAAAREASLQAALQGAEQAAQQAQLSAEADRATCCELQQRIMAYDDLWHRLRLELLQPCTGSGVTSLSEGAQPFGQEATDEALLSAVRTLRTRLGEQAARGAAAADAAVAAAAAAAADAAGWRTRAQDAAADAAHATLASEELRNSLGSALAALHEDAALLDATNANLTAELEQRQAQVAALTASNTELEAKVVRLGAELGSTRGLRAALQAELLEAGGRHAALEAQLSELQDELREACRRKDELAVEVSELQDELREVRGHKVELTAHVTDLEGELREARVRAEAHRFDVETAQRQLQEELAAVRKEGRLEAAAAAERLEAALAEASDHLAANRRASEQESEQLRLQITDLYERLGQARARGRAEAERQEEARTWERLEERAVRTALQEEIAAWASAAMCARAFRAAERAASAETVLQEQRHAVQQTTRLICVRAALCQDFRDADTAAKAAAERMKLAEKGYGEAVAALAAGQSAEAARVMELKALLEGSNARRRELQTGLSDIRLERDGLIARLLEMQGKLADGEAAAAGLSVQLNEALTVSAVNRAEASVACTRAAEAESSLARVQAELACAQKAYSDANQALSTREASALALQQALEGRLASSVSDVDALRQHVATLRVERQELQAALASVASELEARATSVVSLRVDLEVQLAAATSTHKVLQQQYAAAEAERQQLMQRVEATTSALQAFDEECARLRAECKELHVELDQARSELKATTALLDASRAESDEARAELEGVRAELGGVRAGFECQRAAHAQMTGAQLPLVTKAQTKSTGLQPGATAAASASGQRSRALNWCPGPLSYSVDVVADAEAEAEAEGMNGAALGGDAMTAAAMCHVSSDGARPVWSRFSADLPQYDQRYDHEHDVQRTQAAEAMRITNVVWPSTAAPRSSLDMRARLSASGCLSCGNAGDEMQRLHCSSERHQYASPASNTGETSTFQGQASCSRCPILGAVPSSISDVRAVEPGQAITNAEAQCADLRQQLAELRELTEAERAAHAARSITLKALWGAERRELQRQLEVALTAAACGVPLQLSGCVHIGNPWEGLWPSASLEPRTSAPVIGDGDVTTTSVQTTGGDAPCRVHRRSCDLLQRPRTGLPTQRMGLPPLPPPSEPLPPQLAQQQQQLGLPLHRWSSRNSTSSSGSHGSSSYWLPAAAAMAAAAGEYDPYHEPLWVTNAAFVGGGAVFGGGSSAAPSDSPVTDLADTITALRAELAASQEALRKVLSTPAADEASRTLADYAGAACIASATAGGDSDSSPTVEAVATSHHREGVACQLGLPTSLSQPEDAAARSAGTGESLELERVLEAERGAQVVRHVMLRALRNVERGALQRELADTRLARAAAAAAAGETRSRLTTLLAAHARVCGEVELLRAVRDELAAELGPARCLVERLRSQNEQLRAEAREAEAQRAADTAAAAEEARTRIAALELREKELAARCEELTTRCEDLETQLRSAAAAAAAAAAVRPTQDAAAAREAQLASQVTELRVEQAASVAALDRLRAEYAAARHDRQRLQQQLVSLLAQTAAVQEAAAELCGSLRAAHADLDEQKLKLDEQRTEVARVQAESAVARQQLARARADGRQRAAETRAWARQALLLQEQLAVMAQGARTGLLPQSSFGDSVGTSASTPAAAGAAPSMVFARGGTVRSPSPETSGAASLAAASALLRGGGWAPAGRCSSGGAGLGRRCLSAIDLSSLAHQAEEAVAAAELVGPYAELPHQQQGPSPSPQQPPQQQHALHGLQASVMLRSGAAAGASSFLSGLPSVNLHHLALLQGRGAWNALAVGALGSHMRHIARLRGCATAGGAPEAAVAATQEVPAKPLTADGSASTSTGGEGGTADAVSAASGAEVKAGMYTGAPAAAAAAMWEAASEPRASVVQAADCAQASDVGCAPTCYAGAASAPQTVGPAESVPVLQDTALRQAAAASSEEQQGSQREGPSQAPSNSSAGGLVTFGLAVTPLAPAPAAEPSPAEMLRWSLSAGGVSPRDVRQRALSITGHGQLRQLKEEEGEGEEVSGREQDRVDEDDSAWLAAGQQWEAGDQVDEDAEADGAGDDGVEDGPADEDVPLIAAGFPRTLGRAASEADMHLFYNPMFATPCPQPSRAQDQQRGQSQDLAILDGVRTSAGHQLPAAAGRAYLSHSPGAGSAGGLARRLSIGPVSESASAQLQNRLPFWPTAMSPSAAAPGAAVSANGGCAAGPAAPAATPSESGEQLVPVSRSNPMVKLYRKISRRLSSASRDSREGL